MKKNIFVFFVTSIVVLFSSCSKDPSPPAEPAINPLDTIKTYSGLLLSTVGKMELNFSHYFKNQPIVYGTQEYITQAKDTITFSGIEYRISNIQLKNKLNNTWTNIGTYNLYKGEDAFKYNIIINNVPAGLYESIRFNIGVDSIANSTGEQKGALDPALGMYWSWASGYIFYRLEGRTKDLNTFSLDIGGNKNLVNATLDFGAYKVKNGASGTDVQIKMDISKVFDFPNVYDLKVDKRNIHNPNEPSLSKIVSNMGNMLSLQEIKLK